MNTKSRITMLFLILFAALACTALAEPITMRLAFETAEGSHGYVNGLTPWLKQIDAATQGRVKIQVFANQTLCKSKDDYNALKSGLADIAWCFYGYWPGMTPLADVISLPGLPFKTAEKGSETLWKLYEKFPSIQQEFKDTKPLVFFTSAPYTLVTTKKWVKTLEDLQGLKLRMTGGPPTSMVNALGGTPMLIGMPDVYMSLQKGVIDGMGAPWEAVHSFKFFEVANFYTEVPFPAVYFSFSMNNAKWNSLPKDLQEAIMSVCGLKGSMQCGKGFFDTAKDVVIQDVQNAGKKMNYYSLPKQERDRWLEKGGKPIWASWVKDMEAKGQAEAQTIMDTCIELSDQVQ